MNFFAKGKDAVSATLTSHPANANEEGMGHSASAPPSPHFDPPDTPEKSPEVLPASGEAPPAGEFQDDSHPVPTETGATGATGATDDEGLPGAADTLQRDYTAQLIVKNHLIAVMGASLVPVPLVDLVALVTIQLRMLRQLAHHYDVSFSEHRAKSLVASLLGGVLPTSAAIGLASLAKGMPGVGTATGVIAVSAIGGAATYAIGTVFARHFEAGGNLLDFQPKETRTFFADQFRQGKAVVAQLRERQRAKDD
ncbi:MAG: YcjF family protein [Candidatus Competibacterales bacterium]